VININKNYSGNARHVALKSPLSKKSELSLPTVKEELNETTRHFMATKRGSERGMVRGDSTIIAARRAAHRALLTRDKGSE